MLERGNNTIMWSSGLCSKDKRQREKHTEATYVASELFEQELNIRRQGRHWNLSDASSVPLEGVTQMS